MAEPEFETFEEEIAYYDQRRKDRIARVTAALAVSPAVILILPRANQPTWRELAIVSRDTHPDPSGPIRVSSFLPDGPWGHENVASDTAAAESIAEKSWKDISPATDDEVIAWTSTPEFQHGTQVAALIQAGNALRYRAMGNEAKAAAAELERKAHALFAEYPEAAIGMLEDALREQGTPVPNPPYTSLTPNPDWVTSVLATNFDLLEDRVPARWLPRLQEVRPGPRGSVLAEMREYGCGGYGCVLPTLDPAVVLKVTTDTTEAEFATRLANELVEPICVRYHLVIRMAARHRGVPIQLLWRDAADRVGKLRDDLGEHMENLVNEQQRYAADAYDALYRGAAEAVVSQRLHTWLDFLDAQSKAKHTKKPIADLFAGMHRVFSEQKILFGDVHAGNLGLVTTDRGKRWLIVDPGNIGVLT